MNAYNFESLSTLGAGPAPQGLLQDIYQRRQQFLGYRINTLHKKGLSSVPPRASLLASVCAQCPSPRSLPSSST